MVVFALVLRRAARVVPREVFVGVIVLMHAVIDFGASGSRRVVKRRVDGALGTHAQPVGGGARAPAAVRVVQALRALLERAARRGALAALGPRQHEPAHAARAVHRLVRRRYALAQVRRPTALLETSLATV